jgi:hypothetical protein
MFFFIIRTWGLGIGHQALGDAVIDYLFNTNPNYKKEERFLFLDEPQRGSI